MWLAALLGLLLSVAVARAAEAEGRCAPGALRELAEALDEELRCSARGGDLARCRQRAGATDCGVVARDESLALLLGAPGELEAFRAAAGGGERRCHRRALKAARRYLRVRAVERARGERVARGARRFARRVAHFCDGVAVGPSPVPFGPPCRSLLEEGAPVPGPALARCLRAGLETAVDRAAPAPMRPNVVLVLTDDQRPETVDFMPAVERLAREGTRFENAFVTSTTCTPSRASVYTGQYVHNHGSTTNHQAFYDGESLAPWLARAGYATGLFGKYRNDAVRGGHVPPGWSEWQAFSDVGNEQRCPGGGRCFFDYYLNENGVLAFYGDRERDYSTDLLARRLRRFVRAHRDVPFFAVYAPVAPHRPIQAAPRHEGRLGLVPPWRPPSWLADVSGKPGWVRYNRVVESGRPGFADAIDAARLAELEALQAVDEAVASLDRKLERLGLSDNTVLVYTSDHGVHWGEHWWAAKHTPYEPSIRVPMIVRHARAAPVPAVRSQLALNIDLAPTIAALAGAELPTGIHAPDGQSLLPTLTEDAPGREAFLIVNDIDFLVRPSRAVRTRAWKYIRTDEGPDGIFEELYDLEADPDELVNLAGEAGHGPIRRELALRLRLLERCGATTAPPCQLQ